MFAQYISFDKLCGYSQEEIPCIGIIKYLLYITKGHEVLSSMVNLNLIFIGERQSAASLLDWTITLPNVTVQGVVTDYENPLSPVVSVAKKHQIPIMSIIDVYDKINSDNSWVNFAVSYTHSIKLKTPLIDKLMYGCINFHPAPLPKYRGKGGYNRAILQELSQWGASAHYVDSEFDTGAIIRTFYFSIDYRIETAFSLHKKTFKIQESLYKSVLLDVIKHGRLPSIVQKSEDGIYLSQEDMLQMKKIDLACEKDLDKKVQAFWFPPYDGAYVEVNGEKYTLINSHILNEIVNKNNGYDKS